MECARQWEPGDGEVGGGAAELLAALRNAHSDLRAQIANMDRVTQGPTADSVAYASARWKISQASLKRRQLAVAARKPLLSASNAEDRAALRALDEAEQQMSRRSGDHVRTWTIAKIDRDWGGYCEASRLVRGYMDAHLELERRKLFPLLARAAARQTNPLHYG